MFVSKNGDTKKLQIATYPDETFVGKMTVGRKFLVISKKNSDEYLVAKRDDFQSLNTCSHFVGRFGLLTKNEVFRE